MQKLILHDAFLSKRKWTKLKNGLFGWRVIRESRLQKDASLSHKTTNANTSEFRWQPKLDLMEKEVNETKLGNTIQTKRKRTFSNNICEERNTLGKLDSDNDLDLDGTKRRKCPVGS